MAVRSNIGKLSGAIRTGQVAARNVDFGPPPDFTYQMTQYSVGDWDFVDTEPLAFLMNLHNWGSEEFRVIKGQTGRRE